MWVVVCNNIYNKLDKQLIINKEDSMVYQHWMGSAPILQQAELTSGQDS